MLKASSEAKEKERGESKDEYNEIVAILPQRYRVEKRIDQAEIKRIRKERYGVEV